MQKSPLSLPPPDEKITLPPQAILNELKAFAQSGDITSLSTAIADLAVLESCKYQRIAEQLNKLAENFLLMEIEKLITRYEKD